MNTGLHDDLINYRISRAKETLKEVQLLLENGLWNTAVNRLYYACYYAVIALLLKHNIKTQTHSGVRQMFGLHFVKEGIVDKDLGKFFSDIFDLRQSSDYDDYVTYSKEDVIDLVEPATDLINNIEQLLSKEQSNN